MKKLSKSIMNGILMGTILFGFLFPITSYAEIKGNPRTVQVKDSYTADEISVLLREDGYLVKKVSPDVLEINLSDWPFRIAVDHTGITFVAIYKNKSLPDINQWNMDSRFGTVASMDGDVILGYRFFTWGGVSETYILAMVYVFIMQSEQLNKYFSNK